MGGVGADGRCRALKHPQADASWKTLALTCWRCHQFRDWNATRFEILLKMTVLKNALRNELSRIQQHQPVDDVIRRARCARSR
jgi:hypothetical protein